MGSSWVGLGREIPEDQQTLWVGDHYGFWADDTALYVWLTALGGVIDAAADAPDWLMKLRETWTDIPTGGGCVFTSLEEYIVDDNRSGVLLHYSVETLQRLLDAGGDAQQAFEEVRQISDPDISLDSSVGARGGMVELAVSFLKLLRGQIPTGERLLPAIGYLAWDRD